jgi:hypothetical protein
LGAANDQSAAMIERVEEQSRDGVLVACNSDIGIELGIW